MRADAVALHAAHRHRLQSGDQAAPVGAHGREAARHRARAFDRAIHQTDDVFHVAARRGVLLAQLRDHAAQHECHTGQVLAQAVMQVRADTQLLAAGDLQDLAFQPAAFGHIGDHREPMGRAIECVSVATQAASKVEPSRRRHLNSTGATARGCADRP